MTKSDIVDKISASVGINRIEANTAIEAFLQAIKSSLKKNEKVIISGFGSFTVTKRKARIGRNPKTGAAIKISASKNPKFTPSKTLKGFLN